VTTSAWENHLFQSKASKQKRHLTKDSVNRRQVLTITTKNLPN